MTTFLAANDNFADGELPTSIPTDKAALREELARMTAGKPVTVCPPGKRPEVLTPWRPMRNSANDNAPQSWPLAEALRREGRSDDIEMCEHYRGLWSIMAADPLQGRDPNLMEGEEDATIESRSAFGEDGELDYKEVRQVARTPGEQGKAIAKADGESGDRYRVTTSRFSENTLIAQIDMRESWKRLRLAIRPLLPAFEDACLDGMTLTEVGVARGFNGKQASAVGKALVFTAIDALTEEWGVSRREERAREAQAEGNVIRFRARRERRVAAYLGKAA